MKPLRIFSLLLVLALGIHSLSAQEEENRRGDRGGRGTGGLHRGRRRRWLEGPIQLHLHLSSVFRLKARLWGPLRPDGASPQSFLYGAALPCLSPRMGPL